MTTRAFNLNAVDDSWKTCIQEGLKKIDPSYLASLLESSEWLPGSDKIFNAFSLPLERVNYVLFGESPYPRRESANGFAFWDAAVTDLWSAGGLSKKINRATSLRNIFKMLLLAEGYLTPDNCTQEAIANICKNSLVQTAPEFFQQLLNRGFLLLNATPVLNMKNPQKDARMWQPFMQHLLIYFLSKRPQAKFILLGRIANQIDNLVAHLPVEKIYAEHPYNHSFIQNQTIIKFFEPLHLLQK